MDFAPGRKQLRWVEVNGRPLGNSTRLTRWSAAAAAAAADGTISAKCQIAGLTVQIGFLTSFSGDQAFDLLQCLARMDSLPYTSAQTCSAGRQIVANSW